MENNLCTTTGLGLATSTLGSRFTYDKLDDDVKQKCPKEWFVRFKDGGLNGIDPGSKGLRRLIVDALQERVKQWSWGSELVTTCWFMMCRLAFSILDDDHGDEREQQSLRYALSHLVVEDDMYLQHAFAKMMRNLGACDSAILDCKSCNKIREEYEQVPKMAYSGNVFKYEHYGIGTLSPLDDGFVVVANEFLYENRKCLEVMKVLFSPLEGYNSVVKEGAILPKDGFELRFSDLSCDGFACVHRPIAELFVKVLHTYIAPSMPVNKAAVIQPLAKNIENVDKKGRAVLKKMEDQDWNIRMLDVSGYVIDSNVSTLRTSYYNMVDTETKDLSCLKRFYVALFGMARGRDSVMFGERFTRRELQATIDDVLPNFITCADGPSNTGWLWKPHCSKSASIERTFNYTWRLSLPCSDKSVKHLAVQDVNGIHLSCPLLFGFPNLDDEGGINGDFDKLVRIISLETKKVSLLLLHCSPQTLSESKLLQKLFRLITDHLGKYLIVCSSHRTVLEGWEELLQSSTGNLTVHHLIIGPHDNDVGKYFHLPNENMIRDQSSGKDQLLQLLQWFYVMGNLSKSSQDLDDFVNRLPLYLLNGIDSNMVDAVLVEEEARLQKHHPQDNGDDAKMEVENNDGEATKGSQVRTVYIGELRNGIAYGEDDVSRVLRMVHRSALQDQPLDSIDVTPTLDSIQQDFLAGLSVCKHLKFDNVTSDSHNSDDLILDGLSDSLREIYQSSSTDGCGCCAKFRTSLQNLTHQNKRDFVKQVIQPNWKDDCGNAVKRQRQVLMKISSGLLKHLRLAYKNQRLLVVCVGQVANRLTSCLAEEGFETLPFDVPNPGKVSYAKTIHQLNSVRSKLWLLKNYLIAFKEQRQDEANLLTSLKLKRKSRASFYAQLAKTHSAFDDRQLKTQARHALHDLRLLVAQQAEEDAKRLNKLRYGTGYVENQVDLSNMRLGPTRAELLSSPIATAIDVRDHMQHLTGFEATSKGNKAKTDKPCSQVLTCTPSGKQVDFYSYLSIVTEMGFNLDTEECKAQLQQLESTNTIEHLLSCVAKWSFSVNGDSLDEDMLQSLQVETDSVATCGNSQPPRVTRAVDGNSAAYLLVRIRLILLLHLTTRVPTGIQVLGIVDISIMYVGEWYVKTNFGSEPKGCSPVVRFLHRSVFGHSDDSFTTCDVLPTPSTLAEGFGSLIACGNDNCEDCKAILEAQYSGTGKKKRLLYSLPQKPRRCVTALRKYEAFLNYLAMMLAVHIKMSMINSRRVLLVPLGRSAQTVVEYTKNVEQLSFLFGDSACLILPFQVSHPNRVQFTTKKEEKINIQREYYQLHRYLVRFKNNTVETSSNPLSMGDAAGASDTSVATADVDHGTNRSPFMSEREFVKLLCVVYPLFSATKPKRGLRNLKLPVPQDVVAMRNNVFRVDDRVSGMLLQGLCHQKSTLFRPKVLAYLEQLDNRNESTDGNGAKVEPLVELIDNAVDESQTRKRRYPTSSSPEPAPEQEPKLTCYSLESAENKTAKRLCLTNTASSTEEDGTNATVKGTCREQEHHPEAMEEVPNQPCGNGTNSESNDGFRAFRPKVPVIKLVPEVKLTHTFLQVDKKVASDVLLRSIQKLLANFANQWPEMQRDNQSPQVHDPNEYQTVVKSILMQLLQVQFFSNSRHNTALRRGMNDTFAALLDMCFEGVKSNNIISFRSTKLKLVEKHCLGILFDLKVQNCFNESTSITTDGVSFHLTSKRKLSQEKKTTNKKQTGTVEVAENNEIPHEVHVGLDIGKTSMVASGLATESLIGRYITRKAEVELLLHQEIEQLKLVILDKYNKAKAKQIPKVQVFENVSAFCCLLHELVVLREQTKTQQMSNVLNHEKESEESAHAASSSENVKFAQQLINVLLDVTDNITGVNTDALKQLHWYNVFRRIKQYQQVHLLTILRKGLLQASNSIHNLLCSIVNIAKQPHVLDQHRMRKVLEESNPRRWNATARGANITSGLYHFEMQSTHLRQVVEKVLKIADTCLEGNISRHTLESNLVQLNKLPLTDEEVLAHLRYRYRVFPLLDVIYNSNSIKHCRRERSIRYRQFVANCTRLLTKDLPEAIVNEGDGVLQSNVLFPSGSKRTVKERTTTHLNKSEMNRFLQSNKRFRKSKKTKTSTEINLVGKGKEPPDKSRMVVGPISKKTKTSTEINLVGKEKEPPDKSRIVVGRIKINIDNFTFGANHRSTAFPCQKLLKGITSYIASREDLRKRVTISLAKGFRSSKQGASLAAYLCHLGQIDHKQVGPEMQPLDGWKGPVPTGFKYVYCPYSKTISMRDAPAAMSMSILSLIEDLGAPRPAIFRARNKHTKVYKKRKG